MLVLPQLIDGPWSNRPRVAILEIMGQIGVQVRAQEMVRTNVPPESSLRTGGEHELKGIDGSWRLFSVSSA